MQLLLDTNVLIDYLARRKPYFEDILKLCIAQHFGDVRLWVNVQSYADACYILRRHVSESKLRAMMVESLKIFSPCGSHASDLRPALESGWPDVEDFLIAHSGMHVGVDCILTRDLEGFADSPVPVLTPSQFLRQLQEEHNLEYESLTV